MKKSDRGWHPSLWVGTAGCVMELLPDRDQDNKEGIKFRC